MNLPLLLIGILLAFAVFGATLNAVARSIEVQGPLQWAHLGSAGCVLLAMAGLFAVSEGWSLFGLAPKPVVIVAGGALLVAAGVAVVLEKGWKRLTPTPLAIFGGVAASGAPFA